MGSVDRENKNVKQTMLSIPIVGSVKEISMGKSEN